MTTRAAIYTRLSRDKEDATSTTRQEADARRLAKTKAWKITGVYVDPDHSAYRRSDNRKVHRPEYERLLDDVTAGAVDAVIVWKVDRLARSLVEFVRFAETCERHGVALVSVNEPIDTSTPFGAALLQILAVFAQLESAAISLRVKSARDYEAKAGRPHYGGRRRYGYTRDMGVDPAEATLVKEAVDHVLAGGSLNGLANQWNERGIGSPSRSTWTVKTLSTMLRSPHLAGLRTHNGTVVAEGTWEPIIDRVTHAAVVAALSGRTRRPVKRTYLLTGGLARCGRPGCGAALIAHAPRPGKRGYRCPKVPGMAGCGSLSITGGLEDYVIREVFDALDTPALLALLRTPAERGDDEETTILRDRLTRVHQTESVLDPEDYRALTADLEARLDAALRRQASRTRSPLADLPTSHKALLQWWDTATVQNRAALLALVIDRVVVHPGRPGTTSFDESRVEIVWKA
ncbi:MAG: recombinase family protein [Acidimicrobiia bacterium]